MLIWDDAGHGGKDPGATFGGIKEKDIVLDISNRFVKSLSRQNLKVKRTRSGDITVSSNCRASKIKSSGAKLCISHHANMGKGIGAEILVSKYNDKKLAKEILNQIKATGMPVSRGVKTRQLSNGNDYYFMHRLTGNVTTLIIEYGVLDTKSDREFLMIPENRQKLADAVVKAICKYEGIKYVEDKPTPPKSNGKTTYYRVVTGSFTDKKNADQRLKELKKLGFESFIDIFEK